MASLVDRGDNYHVIYLGSCMMAQMSTGLGVVQKPLRELYIQYKQAEKNSKPQERYLLMSGNGMTMTYRESPQKPPQDIFYNMPSILFWDAVQFVTVKGEKKRVFGAFEPLDNDHSRNKDNLFGVLDKKYNFLQQMQHEPLFVCVLRRTSGVKALDVHAFVCKSDEEAIGLVRALNLLQASYQNGEVNETGVFGYKPFADHPAVPAENIAMGNSNRHSAFGGSTERLYINHEHRQQLVKEERPIIKPQQSQSSSANLNKRSSEHNNNKSDQSGRVFQLTQEDFGRNNQSTRNPSPSEERPPPSSGHFGSVGRHSIINEEEEGEENTEHVYQYIKELQTQDRTNLNERGPRVGAVKPIKTQSSFTSTLGVREALGETETSPTARIYSGGASKPKEIPKSYHGSPFKKDNSYSKSSKSNSPKSPTVFTSTLGVREAYAKQPTPPKPSPQEFNSITRSLDIPDETIESRRGSSSSAKLGQSSGRMVSSSRTPQRPTSPSYDHALPENTLERAKRLREQSTKGPVKVFPIQGVSTPSGGYSKKPTNPLPSGPTRGFYGSQPNLATSDSPSRPVAKVTPQKLSGFGGIQVLPTPKGMPQKSQDDSYIRNKVTQKTTGVYYDDRDAVAAPHMANAPRRTKSQYIVDRNSSSPPQGYSQANKTKNENNWEFKPSQKSQKDPGSLPKGPSKPGDRTMNEKLLQSQKKDAEIASAMQQMSFGHNYRPEKSVSGTNFEQALGYLP